MTFDLITMGRVGVDLYPEPLRPADASESRPATCRRPPPDVP